jgi:tRNA A37 threonylcarbamoyladenosine synthetase subunit TsaC/SUA5/YrdC
MTPNQMPEPFSLAELDAALGALRRGEIVVYPTETFYGLGVNALANSRRRHSAWQTASGPGH